MVLLLLKAKKLSGLQDMGEDREAEAKGNSHSNLELPDLLGGHAQNVLRYDVVSGELHT